MAKLLSWQAGMSQDMIEDDIEHLRWGSKVASVPTINPYKQERLYAQPTAYVPSYLNDWNTKYEDITSTQFVDNLKDYTIEDLRWVFSYVDIEYITIDETWICNETWKTCYKIWDSIFVENEHWEIDKNFSFKLLHPSSIFNFSSQDDVLTKLSPDQVKITKNYYYRLDEVVNQYENYIYEKNEFQDLDDSYSQNLLLQEAILEDHVSYDEDVQNMNYDIESNNHIVLSNKQYNVQNWRYEKKFNEGLINEFVDKKRGKASNARKPNNRQRERAA